MAENLGNWPSGHGQITKIWPSDRCGGKTIPAAMQFGYNLREFGGYLGNVGLIVKISEIQSAVVSFSEFISERVLFFAVSGHLVYVLFNSEVFSKLGEYIIEIHTFLLQDDVKPIIDFYGLSAIVPVFLLFVVISFLHLHFLFVVWLGRLVPPQLALRGYSSWSNAVPDHLVRLWMIDRAKTELHDFLVNIEKEAFTLMNENVRTDSEDPAARQSSISFRVANFAKAYAFLYLFLTLFVIVLQYHGVITKSNSITDTLWYPIVAVVLYFYFAIRHLAFFKASIDNAVNDGAITESCVRRWIEGGVSW